MSSLSLEAFKQSPVGGSAERILSRKLRHSDLSQLVLPYILVPYTLLLGFSSISQLFLDQVLMFQIKDWEDGPLGKMLAMQACRPEFRP